MTDKQIIDGVDVSECKNFSCGRCEEENKIPRTINHFTADCKMYPKCYYKQLKRKEQKCEELKEKCKKYGEINEQETKDYAELKNKTEKYKQTLTEIKEIAEENDDLLRGYHKEWANNKLILQKISEVEDD